MLLGSCQRRIIWWCINIELNRIKYLCIFLYISTWWNISSSFRICYAAPHLLIIRLALNIQHPRWTRLLWKLSSAFSGCPESKVGEILLSPKLYWLSQDEDPDNSLSGCVAKSHILHEMLLIYAKYVGSRHAMPVVCQINDSSLIYQTAAFVFMSHGRKKEARAANDLPNPIRSSTRRRILKSNS